jgi:hypothetical protein
MLITKIEQAELIVSANKQLRWDGWDIIERYESHKGYSNKFGSYINKKWGIDTRFKLTRHGWQLPNKYKVVNNG